MHWNITICSTAAGTVLKTIVVFGRCSSGNTPTIGGNDTSALSHCCSRPTLTPTSTQMIGRLTPCNLFLCAATLRATLRATPRTAAGTNVTPLVELMIIYGINPTNVLFYSTPKKNY